MRPFWGIGWGPVGAITYLSALAPLPDPTLSLSFGHTTDYVARRHETGSYEGTANGTAAATGTSVTGTTAAAADIASIRVVPRPARQGDQGGGAAIYGAHAPEGDQDQPVAAARDFRVLHVAADAGGR